MSAEVSHGRMEEARDAVVDALNIAIQGKRFMVAVFGVTPEGRPTLIRRTTNEFPSGEFGQAIGLLAADLINEKTRILNQAPPAFAPLPAVELPVATPAE